MVGDRAFGIGAQPGPRNALLNIISDSKLIYLKTLQQPGGTRHAKWFKHALLHQVIEGLLARGFRHSTDYPSAQIAIFPLFTSFCLEVILAITIARTVRRQKALQMVDQQGAGTVSAVKSSTS